MRPANNIKEIAHVFEDVFLRTLTEEGGSIAPDVMEQTKSSLAAIASRIKDITVMLAKGDVDAASAKTLLAMQKESITEQLLAVTGISKVILQSSINAAMRAIIAAVNNL